MWAYTRLIVLSSLLVVVAWYVGYTTYFAETEKETFVAITQSVSSVSDKEWYIWFEMPEYARILEEAIELERFPNVVIDTKAKRVFKQADYPLVRIQAALTKNELKSMFSPYNITYIEEVPQMSIFSDWSLPLLKNIKSCLSSRDSILGIIDTHFWAEAAQSLNMYYVTDPGSWNNGSATTLLAWWAAVIWIDVSENDMYLPYALEWMVLAQNLWVERLLMWWGGDVEFIESYKTFIDLFPDMQLIAPLSTLEETYYPASLPWVIGISTHDMDELICIL